MGLPSAKLRRLHARSAMLGLGGLSSAIALLAPLSPLAAQTAPPTPLTRDQLDPVKDRQEAPPAKLTVEGGIERSPCALDDPAYAKIHITLNKVVFNNLGPVTQAEIADSYAAFIGRDQPISILCTIRDTAATKLRASGYVAAVQVPVQRIENGEVAFEVLYAKIVSLHVTGKPGKNARLIEAYLASLTDGQVFNRFAAERHLLLARDIPGMDVRLALKPAGTGAGNMVGEITIRSVPLIVDFSSQNYASRTTGRFGGQLRATIHGLTGMGDRTTLGLYSTSDFEEQQIFQAGHDMLVGGDGLRMGAHLTYAVTRPGLGPTVPNVEARTTYTNVEIGYPVVLRQAFTLRANAGLDLVDQNVDFGGLPLSKDRLRVGYARFDVDALDLKGVGPDGSIGWKVHGALELRKGLNLFGTSENCATATAICSAAGFVPPSLPEGDPQAFVLRGSAQVEVYPTRKLTMRVVPRFQYTGYQLFSFEQLSTGNYVVGRGYDPGAAVGDKGLGFTADLSVNQFRLNPRSDVTLQPYGFADAAWLWDEGADVQSRQQIFSVGGGVRLGLADYGRLDFTAAIPLSKLSGETTRRQVRLLVSYSTTILPRRSR